ncbi:hypothetical protein BCR33DRAFT_726270 [Rhizoclosmatium globosum]|uniref:holo-[acyl-carrier-protein] synthase n=1 Tax=Rhizoclosmatium globosum TaxID=329046 RepID=A0A1Y2AV98_9FUNG|nr:hypothetical protein BCR33DRAFT_726270 [Rhizoclosmatium globosum]|eukprot:ORY26406.1 hypothetical protein BCR33DRAFT_726270 [Rhizoclosmatium globosum]
MRFHFIADRKRATATCLLIRLMIQALMPSINVKDIEIDRTEFGRPFLVKTPSPPDGLDFNASHHGDFCIVVGCIGSLELNPTETVDNFLSIFQDYQLGASTGWARLHSFFRLWCMKESYTKTLGLGLGLDFKTIEFRESDSAIWKDKDGSLDVFNEAITKGSDVEAFCGITEIPAFEVSVFQRSQ